LSQGEQVLTERIDNNPIEKGRYLAEKDRHSKKNIRRRRDPVASRQKILEAGMRHFARAGIDGARVADIIKEAQLSHRMLYHYFKSKEELYEATLEFAYRQIRDAERELDMEHLDPAEGLARLVGFTFDYYIKKPEFMALLLQENLYGGRYVRRTNHVREIQQPLIASLEDLINRGYRAGVFGRKIDPIQLYIDIAGLCYFGIVHKHILSAVFDSAIAEEVYLLSRKTHVVEFVVAALTSKP